MCSFLCLVNIVVRVAEVTVPSKIFRTLSLLISVKVSGEEVGGKGEMTGENRERIWDRKMVDIGCFRF